jgi:hypothetical protein
MVLTFYRGTEENHEHVSIALLLAKVFELKIFVYKASVLTTALQCSVSLCIKIKYKEVTLNCNVLPSYV